MGELERFEECRPMLFGLAYRLLGGAADAEDVVQDAYLRWRRTDRVENPEAWLTKVVTNLCLNRLTSARTKRERYVGPWLPEPVRGDDSTLGPLETVEQRDSLSFGVLVLLERLTPPERAAFVLREAFGHSHREIAEILELEEAHARQLYRRAREHVGEPRRRFEASPEQRRRILERFLAAALQGDLAGLERLLAEDVAAWADGGGKTVAARRPVFGRTPVARFFATLGRGSRAAHVEARIEWLNDDPALVVVEDGVLVTVVVPEIVGERIAVVRTIVNPDKLAFLAAQLG